MKTSVLAIILMALLMTGCNIKDASDTNSSISGNLKQFAGETLELSEIEVLSALFMDSASIEEDGSFQFELLLSEPGFFRITTAGQFIHLVVFPEDQIIINSDADQLSHYNIQGSDESIQLQKFETSLDSSETIVDSLIRVYNHYQKSMGFKKISFDLDKEYDKVFDQHKSFVEELVYSHPEYLANLILINRRFGRRVVFEEEQDFEILKLVDTKLYAEYPENKHVKDHHERVQQIDQRIIDKKKAEERLRIGKKAPDLNLQDPEGEKIKLSQFEGRPVIISFWAAWNAASRQTNLELISLYNSYKATGLLVYAVSFDTQPELWRAAIKTDKLDWENVSDLGGLSSPVVDYYLVPDRLPYFYLIDSEHIIRFKGKNLDELESSLKEFI